MSRACFKADEGVEYTFDSFSVVSGREQRVEDGRGHDGFGGDTSEPGDELVARAHARKGRMPFIMFAMDTFPPPSCKGPLRRCAPHVKTILACLAADSMRRVVPSGLRTSRHVAIVRHTPTWPLRFVCSPGLPHSFQRHFASIENFPRQARDVHSGDATGLSVAAADEGGGRPPPDERTVKLGKSTMRAASKWLALTVDSRTHSP